MKKVLYFMLMFTLCTLSLAAQTKKSLDTIYVKCDQDDLSGKFYNVSQFKNQLRIHFFFTVKWVLHGTELDSFSFAYTGPKKEGLNSWAIPLIDSQFLKDKEVYTLADFTMKLKGNFLLDILYERKEIIMLYGARSSQKFEVYPVKVGTDLSSEG